MDSRKLKLENAYERVEEHPWEAFLPAESTLLMLGSFPPKRERWKMDFYYPNLQNDMWRILGLIFFHAKNYFLTEEGRAFREDKIRLFLQERGIAMGDTARRVVRQKDNASDRFLEVVEAVDLLRLLQKLPKCKAIAVTGQKAMDTLLTLIDAREPKMGCYVEFVFQGRLLRLYRMPSSSRAYPKSLEEKADYYRKMMLELGFIES